MRAKNRREKLFTFIYLLCCALFDIIKDQRGQFSVFADTIRYAMDLHPRAGQNPFYAHKYIFFTDIPKAEIRWRHL